MTKEEAQIIIGNIPIKPEVLDDCYDITEYQEAKAMAIEALAQKSCEDVISREAVIDAIDKWVKDMGVLIALPANKVTPLFDNIHKLPPVTPQPRIGHWIEHPHETGENWEYSKYECSECYVWEEDDSDYCPNCGARMEVGK